MNENMPDEEMLAEAEEMIRADAASKGVIQAINNAQISAVTTMRVLAHLLVYAALSMKIPKHSLFLGLEGCYDILKEEQFPDVSPSDLN
jgi:hypothetical protein